ncbi:hypothetical protein BS50DRAFT_162301 [Corynespora cassiicola Philippines]|uniref:Uncharacterized protein n=1 Tax=Corynespora cassiicola Philippines TaxID=1448308 RepID=A0A2T2N7K3_CORCC|nr:hypothetical protein BS50DRAFT_162301 [Corynespora cassiicola Philippines]
MMQRQTVAKPMPLRPSVFFSVFSFFFDCARGIVASSFRRELMLSFGAGGRQDPPGRRRSRLAVQAPRGRSRRAALFALPPRAAAGHVEGHGEMRRAPAAAFAKNRRAGGKKKKWCNACCAYSAQSSLGTRGPQPLHHSHAQAQPHMT